MSDADAAPGGPAPARLPRLVRGALALFVVALLCFTKDEPSSWADGSRLGTIQALVEHGTLRLDETDYLWQGDKVRFAGGYYSHQPPMLALLGALPYGILHGVLGRPIDGAYTYRILTWTLVGLPLVLGFAALARLMLRAGAGERWTAALLVLASFGTLAFPYALVLNQHGSAAGLVMLGLWLVARGRPATAGFLLALATAIDLTALFALAAFAWPVLRGGGGRAALVRYALGALPPIALHLGVNRAVAGDFLPFALHLEAFRYPLSPFLVLSLTGGNEGELPGTQAAYVWGATFGQSGLFSHHPWLLLALLAGVRLLLRRGPARHGLPRGVLAGASACALGIAAYYLTQSRNFGGSSFGMRWFTLFAPLLALHPAAWLAGRPPERRAPRAVVALTVALGYWSIGASCVGALQPWTKIAYLPHQEPDALLAPPEAPRPDPVQHLRAELAGAWGFRMSFEREVFELWYADMLTRCGRVYLKRWPGFTPDEQAEWTRSGLVRLQDVADVMRQGGDQSMPHAVTLYWIGRLHEALGDDTRARLAYQQALGLWPRYAAAQKALADLDARALRPRAE